MIQAYLSLRNTEETEGTEENDITNLSTVQGLSISCGKQMTNRNGNKTYVLCGSRRRFAGSANAELPNTECQCRRRFATPTLQWPPGVVLASWLSQLPHISTVL